MKEEETLTTKININNNADIIDEVEMDNLDTMESYESAAELENDDVRKHVNSDDDELDEEINEAIKDVDEYSAKENNAEKMNYLIDVDPNFNEETERRIDETLNESEKRKLFDDDEV